MTQAWWQSGVIYQVYPRSFADADGDGVGDLEGIRRRLPYLAQLGVAAVWLSPIFLSPMADYGYDVADYRGIDPLFGTMADFDALLADAHALGLRVLLDFVPNHSSDRHPWFVESRAGPASTRRDWYIWRDPAPNGGPPNNWMSFFGGPAWEWDAPSGQYYLHLFLKEQPDLNWRNPAVRAAMLDVLRFWLDKGVDGFRVDVLWLIFKDARLRDDPPNPAWREGMQDILRTLPVHSADRPEVHEVVAEMRALLDRFSEGGRDRVLIGEIYLPLDRLMAYYGEGGRGAHLPFNFQLVDVEWSAPAIGRIVAEYEAALPPGGWPNWVLGNHDRARIAARVGERQARIAAMLLLTLRGTPTLYYGDEIGLARVAIPPERVRDPQALREPGIAFNRDEARTPMQWDTSASAGFGPVAGAGAGPMAGVREPWLPLSADHAIRNVAAQDEQADSMLALHRALLALRRAEPALAIGSYRELVRDETVLGYVRQSGGQSGGGRLGVLLNFGATAVTLATPVELVGARVLLSTRGGRTGERLGETIGLAPDEGIIVRAAEDAGLLRSPGLEPGPRVS